MPAPSKHPEAIALGAQALLIASHAVWYLGIDFGTTGVSAVLLNYSTGQRYPICWFYTISMKPDELPTVTSQSTPRSSDEPIFRLPAATYSGPAASKLLIDQSFAPIVVGSLASKLANDQSGVFVENFKPYLNIGIPYYCPKRQEWEPILQLPGQQRISLYWMRRALQALLATLTPNSNRPGSIMKVGAQGLEEETLEDALQQLEGVILGCPATWGDTYRFNVREAVLEAKLVRTPEQIFFLEDAIASLLASCPSSKADARNRGIWGDEENSSSQTQDEEPTLTPELAFPVGRYANDNPYGQPSATLSPPHRNSGDLQNFPPVTSSDDLRLPSPWRGGTLAINVGATTTELALVDLPDDLQQLSYSDFRLCSLPYAGNAINQDIFCQLLYPQLSPEQQQQLLLSDDLEFPQPGQSDPQQRDRLALRLHSSPLGQALLKAAGCLKLILQHKEQFTLALGQQPCTLTRLDLENSVIQPLTQQLHQTLNALLIETGISEQGIYQVLLQGGSAHFNALATWIHKRLPNATLIRDTDSPGGSRVAAGLATLPLYPQLLNRSRQQYSDYFLLLELLRAFPETTGETATRLYSLEEIMQQLERRGLNTGACYKRLVRLVEGQLPEGLVPSIENATWLSPTSQQNVFYSRIATSTGLFSRQGDRSRGTGIAEQLYLRNVEQQERLQQYLQLALSGIYQKFEEPLIVTWDT